MNTKSTSNLDVLICGAGAAGLVLGIELARRGVNFRIIEKLARPFAGSRGKGLQPRTQEIFADLGIIEKIIARGDEYPHQRVHADDGTYQDMPLMESQPESMDVPYHRTMMVPQFATETVLREKLEELGHRVEWETELTEFSQTGNEVRSTLKTPSKTEIIASTYLIGADGGRSFVRRHLGIEFPGRTLPVRAVAADVRLAQPLADRWHRWNEDKPDQLGLCPLRGTDLYVLQAPIPLEGEMDLSAQGLTKFARERSHDPSITVTDIAWVSAFQMNARLADRYRIGNVFLCGDAAHVHPPTGGQGLNTSIQDSYNLAWKLSAVLEGADEGLLDTYEEERRPIAAGMLGLSTRLLKQAAEKGGMRRGRDVQQLDLNYRESSLTLPAHASRPDAPQPGDRAPNAELLGASGHAVQLFDLLRGTHFTLLAYESTEPVESLQRSHLRIHRVGPHLELNDRHGCLHRIYGFSPCDLCLIRPDGYIAALLKNGTAHELEAHLRKLGLRPFA